MRQGHLALEVTAAQGGQKAQLHQQLEAVADAQDQPAGGEEGLELVQHMLAADSFCKAPAQGRCLGRAKVVAIQEPAGEDEEVVILHAHMAGGDV